MRRSAVPGDELAAHQQFEELCALAVIGEITDEEAERLRAHLKVCEECRASGREFEQIVQQELPLAAPLPSESFRERAQFFIARRSFRKRFVALAAQEGIDLPP